jgi:hypothetical protein
VEQVERREHEAALVQRAAVGQQRLVIGVHARELGLPPRVGARGVVARTRLEPFRVRAVLARPDHLVLQPVDAREDARQERRGVAADLVPAQRQVVDPLEQQRQAVRARDRLEQRIDPRLHRLVPQETS